MRSLGIFIGVIVATGSAVIGSACAPPHETKPPSIALPICDQPASGLWDNIYCTGLYKDLTKKLADGVMPYTPGAVLWSDGAEKHRFLYIPPGEQIDTTDLDSWKFPVNTKAWKEFRVDGKLVETRLFWKRDESTWEFGTYRWDDAEKEAPLNTATGGIKLPSGYEIPTKKDCDKCHHGGSDKLLGIEAVALALPNADGATLDSLVANDKLSHPPLHTRINPPEDATQKAGEAQLYLHVNCGMACHSSRGIGHETELVMRLRASEMWPNGPDGDVPQIDATTTDIWNATVLKTPTTAAVAQQFPGADRVTPGHHDKSLVWLLAHLRDGKYQMPPLVSHKIDDAGTQKLADWIDALPPLVGEGEGEGDGGEGDGGEGSEGEGEGEGEGGQ